MRLIFIRHAEPDYEHNTLTRKGFREAELLAPRAAGWNASRYFTSPLNRAKLTAAPALSLLGKEAEIVPWMQEFSYMVKDPVTGRVGVPWDFMPAYWTEQEELHDRHHFYRHPVLSSNPAYEPAVIALRKGLDGILSGYGLTRCGDYYRHDPAVDCEVTLAFFAHLGANCEALGYLLGISPLVLQQTLYLAPTSVSVLNSEERIKGELMFRAQFIGDTSHLTSSGEPVSMMGSFSESILQETPRKKDTSL